MKPRARWLTRFASWFFNTSPEWVAPQQTERQGAEPQQIKQAQQTQQSEAAPNDAPATDAKDPKQPLR